MVWAGVMSAAKTDLWICEGKVNSQKYCEILNKALLPFIKKHPKKKFTFQHDNATIHKSKYTKNYLKTHKIEVMDWPAKSPDLNPIENIWGILARNVYKNGKKQFATVKELEKAIFKEWKAIKTYQCKKVIQSMSKRCVEILKTGGKKVNYQY